MDIIDFTILEDGTITVKTSAISDGNHMKADALMKNLDMLMGGTVRIEKNPEKGAHAHVHSHEHAHAGGHSHDGGKLFHHH